MRRVRTSPDDIALPRCKTRLRHDPLLEDFANQLLKSVGCQKLQVRVFWNPGLRTTAGLAVWSDRMVVLNPKLLEVSSAEVQRTLRHELAHLLAKHRVGRHRIEAHGEEWHQACADLGIPDHVWMEQRATIASIIDGLGDRFKPELRAGWLTYIRQNYPDGPVEAHAIIGDGTLEIDE